MDMMIEIIRVTEEVVTLRSDRPRSVGSKIDLEVTLPDGVLLESFTLSGSITSCKYTTDNECGNYILEMKIGDISPMNKKILEAYIEFLERKEMLNGLKMDLKALQVQEVFTDFGERLSQLRETSEVLRSELEAVSELVTRNLRKNITIH